MRDQGATGEMSLLTKSTSSYTLGSFTATPASQVWASRVGVILGGALCRDGWITGMQPPTKLDLAKTSFTNLVEGRAGSGCNLGGDAKDFMRWRKRMKDPHRGP